MSEIALLLGPIEFQDFEIPSDIKFGGTQRLAVHHLLGGARVVDALGQDDAEINFSGAFSGQNATIRARTLDELRISGATLQLTWDVFFYTVVICRFQASYQNRWWIPFRLSCTVVSDNPSTIIGTVASLAGTAIADIGTASVQAIAAGLDLAGATTSLSAPNAMVRGTAAYVAGQSSLASAQIALGSAATAAAVTLDGAGLNGATSAAAGIAGLSIAVSSAQQLSLLTNAQAYTGRAANNLANAST
jgi:hypothetical protein